MMRVDNKVLVLDFLEWVAKGPRSYSEVMDAWRTSCPRLSIWEDAVDLGLVVSVREVGAEEMIGVTPSGRAFLRLERRAGALG